MKIRDNNFSTEEKIQYLNNAVETISKGALEYQDDIDRLHHDDHYLEFDFSKSKQRYERIARRLQDSKLQEANVELLYATDLKTLKQQLYDILTQTFGRQEKDKIQELLLFIKPQNQPTLFDVPTLYGEQRETLAFHPDNRLDEIEILPLIHMFTLSLLNRHLETNFSNVFGNKNYTILIPTLMEFIAAYELRGSVKDKHFEERHELFKLNNTQSTIKMASSSEEQYLNLQKVISAYKKDREKYEFLRYKLQAMKRVEEHSRFGIVISDIYSTRLLEKYKEDPATMRIILEAILKGQKSTLDFLRYYNVSLSNKETYETYDNKITKYLAR